MSSINDDFVLKCQAGLPIFLKDICILYPATLRDIARIGYSDFQSYLAVWLLEKPVLDDSDDLSVIVKQLTDFQYFLLLTNSEASIATKAKNGFKFFTKENVIFSAKQEKIVVGPIEEQHLMGEDDFNLFRQYLKKMYFIDSSDDIVINESDDERVRALKMQLIERHRKLAKQKSNSNNSNLEFSDLIGSLAAGESTLNISNIWDITYYAFHDQLKRMEWREQFNINNRAALAGAKIDKKQLKHWIRSISDDN